MSAIIVAGTVHRTVPTSRQYIGLPGKPGNANISLDRNVGAFFCLKVSTGHFLYGRTIIGLPRKIGNANTKPRLKSRGFFLAKTCHRHVFYARLPQGDFLRCASVAILGLPRKIGNANTELHQRWWSFFIF